MGKRNISFILMVWLGGCGYGFVQLQDELPGGVKKVSIPTFQNLTHESGIENRLTADLRKEFYKSKIIQIVSSDEAEAEIQGVVSKAEESALSQTEKELEGRNSKVLSNQYSAELNVKITLIRKSDGKVLWENGFSDSRQYRADNDLLQNETRQQEAFAKVSLYLMEQAHDLMLENF